jgi:hypothetical protein
LIVADRSNQRHVTLEYTSPEMLRHVMPSDWDDYTVDMKLLKHYQSITGVLIWTVSTLRFDVA